MDMNETVKKRFGHLMFSLCEAEILLDDKDRRIAELEAELDKHRSDLSSSPRDEPQPVDGAETLA